VASNLLAGCDILLELGDELTLVVVVSASLSKSLKTWQRLAVGVGELP
jgi:hypothetical protein